jgi:FAD binding domain-containing protein/D-arabinono-1,4-lactone oxidase
MQRSRWVLVALLLGGCGQRQQLHLRRGWEHLHTPRAARTTKAGEAHATAAAAQAPPSCDDVKIKAYNHQVCCRDVKEVVAPATVDELRDLVKSTKGPLRVVGNSHTSNEQICTSGTGLSMANLTTIHGLRRWRGVEYVEVDPGVRMSDLNRWLYDHGRSIGYAVIGFRGITIGGGVATGVHGSSLMHPSVLSSRVEYIEVMDAAGEIKRYHRPAPPQPQMRVLATKVGQLASATPTVRVQQAMMTNPPPPPAAPQAHDRDELKGQDEEVDAERFRALAASVGMLGIVTRIGLRTEPRFNLDVTVDFHQASVLWDQGPEKLVGGCDWGQLVWLPRASRVMRICGMHTSNPSDVQASNSLLAPHVDAGALGAFKELMEDTISNGAYLCTIESERWSQLKWYPPFIRDCCCKTKYGTHVIGPGDLMMSSELTEHQAQLAEIDYEIAIPLRFAKEAMTYVYRAAKDERLCMPLIGAFLRFSPVDESTLIGHSTTDRGWFRGEKVMFLEFVVYVLHEPEDDEERAKQESDYYAKYRQLAADLVQKFHGRPHWAKNQVPVFKIHKEEDKLYAARLKEFHCFVRAADPDNRFGNDFTDAVGLTAPRRATGGSEERVEDCVRRALKEQQP